MALTKSQVSVKEMCRSIATDVINANFAKLKSIDSIVPILLGLISMESSFRIYVKHSMTDASKKGSTAMVYVKQPQIEPLYKIQYKRPIVEQGLVAHSLCAVMGWHHVRGTRLALQAGLQGGGYAGIAEKYGLLVNPGESISNVYTGGDYNVATRSIVAGCIMLEQKVKATGGIVSGVAAYLGKGYDRVTGISTDKYVERVFSYAQTYSTIGPGEKGSPSSVYKYSANRSEAKATVTKNESDKMQKSPAIAGC